MKNMAYMALAMAPVVCVASAQAQTAEEIVDATAVCLTRMAELMETVNETNVEEHVAAMKAAISELDALTERSESLSEEEQTKARNNPELQQKINPALGALTTAVFKLYARGQSGDTAAQRLLELMNAQAVTPGM